MPRGKWAIRQALQRTRTLETRKWHIKAPGFCFGPVKGDGSFLIRLEGSCARAHQGAKNGSAQRANVG